MGVTTQSSFLRINVYFQASGAFTLDWYLNKQRINTGKEIESADNEKEQGKYSSHCIHKNIFEHDCFLYIDYYNAKDIGVYDAVVTLKENSNVTINMSSAVIMPSMFFFSIYIKYRQN
jgi:hypothetical protein